MVSRTTIRAREILADERAWRGNKCEIRGCRETEDLEFAHLYDDGFNNVQRPKHWWSSPGRGMSARAYNIKNHPECYILLCMSHHYAFDQGEITINGRCSPSYLRELKDATKNEN